QKDKTKKHTIEFTNNTHTIAFSAVSFGSSPWLSPLETLANPAKGVEKVPFQSFTSLRNRVTTLVGQRLVVNLISEVCATFVAGLSWFASVFRSAPFKA
ncbi:MAG: hypothetical protein Q4E01_07690, partial [Actinomycetaceae bacterium]|nr:hypothetical protein [Actinomycetaceae bacterium]